MMAWGFFKGGNKQALPSDKQDLKLIVIAGYEPGIQRVRDFERLDQHDDAMVLLRQMAKAIAAALSDCREGFPILVRLYEELRLRRCEDELGAVLEAIKMNPEATTSSGQSVIAAICGSHQNLTLYSCQQCGNFISHLSTPCECCSYHPKSLPDVLKGVTLSTEFFGIGELAEYGSRIRSGEQISSFDVVDTPEIIAAAEKILSLSLGIDASKYRTLRRNSQCANCGNEFDVLPENRCCPKCRSREVDIPPLRVYMLTLKDCLQWLQDVIMVPNSDQFLRAISAIAGLKEDSIQFGRVVTPEVGIPLQRLIESLGPMISKCGSYRFSVGPFEAEGEFVREPSISLDQKQLYIRGPALFNLLSSYLRQGLPMQ